MNREAENLHRRRMQMDRDYRRDYIALAAVAASKFRTTSPKLLAMDATREAVEWILRRCFQRELNRIAHWQEQGVPIERLYGTKRAPDTHGVSRVEYLPSVNRKHAKRPYRNASIVESADVISKPRYPTHEQIAKVIIRHTDELWLSASIDKRMRMCAEMLMVAERAGTDAFNTRPTRQQVIDFMLSHRGLVAETCWKVHRNICDQNGMVTPE